MAIAQWEYGRHPQDFKILGKEENEFSTRLLLSHDILGVSVATLGKDGKVVEVISPDHWSYKEAKNYIRPDWYEQIKFN